MTKHRATRHHNDDPIPAVARAGVSRGLVAIVGRPNVGKSTLFNRLAGAKIAIVHDEPGVTRDRNYADAFARGVEYTLVDTGGFDPGSDDPMRQGIVRQVQIAIAEADVIVCVLDGLVEPTTADREAVKLLRKSDKPVVYAANKADSRDLESQTSDIYRLGISHLFPISALHGRGIAELEEAVVEALPPYDENATIEGVGDDVPRIALIGRPNAGKSSLLNRLVGEERALVDERPGTTRDTVDAIVTVKRKSKDGKETEQKLVVLDTAGIRRKSKVSETVEAVSVLRAVRAIERAQIVVLMCDGAEGVAEQDAKILGLAVERGRGVVIALNKTDLLEKGALSKMEEIAREKLSFTPWAPIERLSVKTGRGVGNLVDTIVKVHEEWAKRVGTSELNKFFGEVLETHPPPTMGGRAVRLYYVTQAQSRPPTFIIVTNQPENVHFSYQRFIQNQIRKRFGFEGTPIRIRYRAKNRRDEEKK